MALPIPKRRSGYGVGNPAAPVQLDFVVDYQCPYSARSWPVVKQVLAKYGPDKLYFVLHPCVLPGHQSAYDVSRAAAVFIRKQPARLLEIVEFLFTHQNEFRNEVMMNKTRKQLLELLAGYASKHFSIPADEFYRSIDDDEALMAVKVPQRFAISKAIWSTPTFLLNDVVAVNVSSSWTLELWSMFLDPFFQ
eukprot:jgi/Chlat1/7721/Chrsp66S07192